MDYRLYFDGGCCPNPGGPASFGWWIEKAEMVDPVRGFEQSIRIAAGSGPVYAAEKQLLTNNTAEFSGIYHGVAWFACLDDQGDGLEIFGDSQLVIKCISGEWKLGKPHLVEYLTRCKMALKTLKCPWTARWIPRAENSEADAIADYAKDRLY